MYKNLLLEDLLEGKNSLKYNFKRSAHDLKIEFFVT